MTSMVRSSNFANRVGACALAALAAGCAAGCIFDWYPGVHFNSYEFDYGKAPRRWSMTSWGQRAVRPIDRSGWDRFPYERDWERLAAKEERRERDTTMARRLLIEAEFDTARPMVRKVLSHAGEDRWWLQDAIELLDATPAPATARMRDYVHALEAYRGGDLPAAMNAARRLAQGRDAVAPHALVLVGYIHSAKQRYEEAARTFASVLVRFPNSPRAEAAAIMVPRSLLRSDPDEEDGGRVTKVRAASIDESREAIAWLLKERPKSRFGWDAGLWLGRCEYVQGAFDAAAERYLSAYGAAGSQEQAERSVTSVRAAIRRMTDEQTRTFGVRLRKDAKLLALYIEYRLHYTSPDAEELRRVVAMSEGLRAEGSPRLLATLAQVAYDEEDYARALAWSESALAKDPRVADGLALYVHAACLAKLERPAEAERGFRRLVEQMPGSYLVLSARENIALICEADNRMGEALDQYMELGYGADCAYLIDAKMTLAELARYVRENEKSEHADVLSYSLAFRYLRMKEYRRAREHLAKLSDEVRHKLAGLDEPERYRIFVDAPFDTLYDPLQTVDDLERLDAAREREGSVSERFEAAFAYASYLYERRNLLFYNHALWQGLRTEAFGWYWNESTATERDTRAVRLHHSQHECLNRAGAEFALAAAIVTPGPEKARALYRAACAARRMADFNPYWRSIESSERKWEQAIELMRKVHALCPTSPLAPTAQKFEKVFEEEKREFDRWHSPPRVH